MLIVAAVMDRSSHCVRYLWSRASALYNMLCTSGLALVSVLGRLTYVTAYKETGGISGR
jgi:hypothetical protein